MKKCPKCGNELKEGMTKCETCNFSEENTISKTLVTIGWLIIIGGIVGSIVLAESNPALQVEGSYYESIEETFNYTILIVGSFSSIISGMLFMALGEIIKLNQMIFNLMRK